MSKINSHTDQILLKAMKVLTPHEFLVFTAWYTDSLDFNSPQSAIVERTGLNKGVVSNQFKGIVEKGILEVAEKVGRSQNYKMTESFLKDIFNGQPMPTAMPETKSILDNPKINSKKEVTREEELMTPEDKHYFKIKAEHEHNKTFLRKECASDMASYLKGAGLDEEQVEFYLKRYVKEVTTIINSLPSKTTKEKESWINNLKSAAESALAEYFPAPEVTRALSKAEEDNLEPTVPGQYGMMTPREYRLQREHADSFPLVDWTQIKPLEPISLEELKEIESSLNASFTSDLSCEVDSNDL